MGKSLLGKLGPEAVGMMELPRLPRDIVEGFRALGDLSGTTSDARGIGRCSSYRFVRRTASEKARGRHSAPEWLKQ